MGYDYFVASSERGVNLVLKRKNKQAFQPADDFKKIYTNTGNSA